MINSGGTCSVDRCGANNCACGDYSSSLSGCNNQVSTDGDYSIIVGGCTNSNYTAYSFIGGGTNNCVVGSSLSCHFTILGGNLNKIDAQDGSQSFIGFGISNTICGGTGIGQYAIDRSAILGGDTNCIKNSYGSFIGVGDLNTISSLYGQACFNVIVGGRTNCICNGASVSFIGGGQEQNITCNSAVIVGGCHNSVSGNFGAILGGCENEVLANCSVVVGGGNNSANEIYSVVVGGKLNSASSYYSFIGGGNANCITSGSNYSAIISGQNNKIESAYSTTSGYYNRLLSGSDYSSSFGQCNTASAYPDVHLLGRQLTANRQCTTFVNNLSIMDIPTSSAGLPSGAVWNNSGVLNIV